MVLQRKIDDVIATTVNRTEMIVGILWTCVELVTAIATIPFPVLSLGLGGLLAFKDAMLAISAYQQGDTAGALKHYIGYLANAGGAVLFDFRPALKALPVRPVTKTLKQATLVNDIDPGIAAGMEPVMFNGEPFWIKNTPDSLGQHVLFSRDPVTGQMQSTARLVNQNTDGNWVRFWLRGGGGRQTHMAMPDEVDQSLVPYEIASEQGSHFRIALDLEYLDNLAHPDDVFQENAFATFQMQLKPLRDSYSKQVDELTKDAQALYASPPARPDRTGLPELATGSNRSTALVTLFSLKKRLIIGASNDSVASKQILIESLPALKAQGLRRLCIENLPADVFRNKLKIINGETTGNVAYALKRVKTHLEQVDKSLGWDKNAPFTYRKLMLEAHKNKIAIDGVDASSSYYMEHVLELSNLERFTPRTSELRNFYSHKALRQNDDGWIALVDEARIGSTNEVPGLADLQNAVALRVEEVAPGQIESILPDTFSPALSRGDYRLTMVPASQTLPTAGPSRAVQVPPSASHYSEFDLPEVHKPKLNDMLLTRDSFNTLRPPATGAPDHSAFEAFKQKRSSLGETAQKAFADYTPPPRADFADLATATTEEAFIEELCKKIRGLFIGEVHSHTYSKQFLIKYMKLLKQKGVKTLYLEHLLTDLHQAELDLFNLTSTMPENLKRYLKQLDARQMPRYKGRDTYTNVVKAAKKAGIRVRALDCTASYHVKGMYMDNARMNLFNYFANEVIKADQLAQGPHNWVALIGDSHCDTFLGVPGIAQLQDAVSLRILDVPPSQALPLQPGGWTIVGPEPGASGTKALRSDFKLHVGIAGTPALPSRTATDHAWLRNVDDFLIEQPSSTEANVVYRTPFGGNESAPIKIDETGKFFTEEIPLLKDKRFTTLEQVSQALRGDAYMSHVSAASLPSARLNKAKYALIERPSSFETWLVHHSETGEIVRTPIEQDFINNKFFIKRWNLDNRRFRTVEQLIEALEKEVKLSFVPTTSSPRARLVSAGNFVVEQQASSPQASVLHRSNDGKIYSTTVKTDAQGQLFIDRWPKLQDKRYSTLDDLIDALVKEVGLEAAL